ncbi:hypothetical protein EMIT07CA2_80240 [Brevibacillus sp. IT-7CA2]
MSERECTGLASFVSVASPVRASAQIWGEPGSILFFSTTYAYARERELDSTSVRQIVQE